MSDTEDQPSPPEPAGLKLSLEPVAAPEPVADEPPEPEPSAQQPPSRRSALARIAGLLAALPFLGGALLALRSGLQPVVEDGPERVPLGRLRDVPEQGLLRRAVTYPVRRGPRVEAQTEVVFLTRHRGAVIAFSARCTHQGCPVVEAKHKEVGENPSPVGPALLCPCHGGAFTATGEPAGGPVKERLPRLRLDLPDSPDGTIQWVRVDG